MSKYHDFISEKNKELYPWYPVEKALKFYGEMTKMFDWLEIPQFNDESPITWDDLTVAGKIKVLEYNYDEL